MAMDIIKKGWKPVTTGRIYNLYTEVMTHAIELRLWSENKKFPLLFTRKSTKTLGSCYSNKNDDGSYDCSIVLNEIMLNYSDSQIRKTIVHEVAHAICPLEHHNANWKRSANLLGKKWGYKIERFSTDTEINDTLAQMKAKKRQYKYELYCPRCGLSWKYERICKAIKYPYRYQCPKDKTKLLSRKIAN